MVMTAAEPLFVDTNVLLYANVTAAPLHEASLNGEGGLPLKLVVDE
jgi:hypothetical protein